VPGPASAGCLRLVVPAPADPAQRQRLSPQGRQLASVCTPASARGAPPANGRRASKQTLRDRIKYHYTGDAEGSTLRKTLGSLLSDELHIELRRVGSGNRMTFVEGERALSTWMSDHARVSWIVDETQWLFEAGVIANLDVPLNVDSNKHNRFHFELVATRAQAVARVRTVPIVPNPGVGGG
jgi:GIY-YIG catalytic domain